MIDLLNIQPNIVSKDLRSYKILLFGDPKSGKTSLAAQIPKCLIISTEVGAKAIPGVYAQPVLDYTSLLTVLNQLKKPEVKEKFDVVCIDTVDALLATVLEHILTSEGVADLNSIPWGKGHEKLESAFRKIFKTILKEGYGLFLIGHRSQKVDEDTDITYNTLALNNKRVRGYVISEVDAMVAVETSRDPAKPPIMHFRASKEWDAGARFKHIVPQAELSYQNLVNAIHEAVEKDSEAFGKVSEEKTNYYKEEKEDVAEEDFSILRNICEKTAKEIINKDEGKMGEILGLIDFTLGKKISETSISDFKNLKVLKEELERF